MNGIIYYTDNRIGEPIRSTVRKYILEAGLPITSASLQPIDFGDNAVIDGVKSYPTMVREIISCLERSTADYVFFCEHDVLYHKSHFDFTPPKDNIFYYNNNVWRWRAWDNIAITYSRMLPLSCLCANRKFVLEHYKMRERKIYEWGLSEFRSREPRLARIWGYEPGTKKIKRGGLTDDDFEMWSSEYPVIDIRHRKSFSRPKCTLEEFKHLPIDWREVPIEKIPGWDLRRLFNI
jgi:hypothetical protein